MGATWANYTTEIMQHNFFSQYSSCTVTYFSPETEALLLKHFFHTSAMFSKARQESSACSVHMSETDIIRSIFSTIRMKARWPTGKRRPFPSRRSRYCLSRLFFPPCFLFSLHSFREPLIGFKSERPQAWSESPHPGSFRHQKRHNIHPPKYPLQEGYFPQLGK